MTENTEMEGINMINKGKRIFYYSSPFVRLNPQVLLRTHT